MIHVVFISDNNYVFPTKIAIKSLIKNKNKNTKYSVNIIGVELTEENINILKSLETNDIKINIICETNKYENIGRILGHVSKAALFKFQIPNIFPDLDKILYLDGDILIEKDLSKLFSINLGNKYAAVVKDYQAELKQFQVFINHRHYFNSGMMLLNLKKMREDDICNKLLENKKNEKKARFMDQDSLNVCFKEEVIYLSPEYNLMLPNLIDYDENDIISFYELIKSKYYNILNKPTILHLTNKKKVWNDITAIKAKEFWSYADNIDILNILEKKYSNKIDEINKEITYLKQKLEKNKKYPKWLCNFICCFIIKKKNRHHFRKKYIK